MANQCNPPEPINLVNGAFSLSIRAGRGMICSLTHVTTGKILAEGPYLYSTGTPDFHSVTVSNGSCVLVGSTESEYEITHHFSVPPGKDFIEERISLRNNSGQPFIGQPRYGFVLPNPSAALGDFTFTAVPFRREPAGRRDQYADFQLDQVLHEKRRSLLRGDMIWKTKFAEGVQERFIDVNPDIPVADDVYASEGWVITDGKDGFLVTKYNPSAMEWSIVDSMQTTEQTSEQTAAGLALRWGGGGIFYGDPEPACQIAPGEVFQFGTTRLTAFAGGVDEGFYTFRREMESRGHVVPTGFNPPLHWNELYDNQLWWQSDCLFNNADKRKELYQLKDMEDAAARGKWMGCEALYLDPGWDVTFASKIWDESRLGRLSNFVDIMHAKYGLKVSLHTPLSGWCDPSSYPADCFRVDQNGNGVPRSLCGASVQYIEESQRRFDVLAGQGASYFMFDGTSFNGECWDKKHGHPVPSRRHDHVAATNRLARLVHEKYPNVLIEMHDQICGPRPVRYVPSYLGYGKDPDGESPALGYDTVWAYELMWDPMLNLNTGNSVCLYYYNLAYSQPLYIHIDLKTDQAEAIMFWWNASTCRHLGIGGTHPDPAVRDAQRRAVTEYIRLKPYFTAGTFYGLDETIHVHRHPTESSAVINCFNIDPWPVTKTIHFRPTQLGLNPNSTYEFRGGDAIVQNGNYQCEITIPPMGHRLIEVVNL